MRFTASFTFTLVLITNFSLANIIEDGYNEYCQDVMLEEVSCDIPSPEKLIFDPEKSGIPRLSGEAGELYKITSAKIKYLESYLHYWEDFYRFIRHKAYKGIPVQTSVVESELHQALFKNLEKNIEDLKVIHEIEKEIKELSLISNDNLSYSSSVFPNKDGMICAVGSKICVKDKREDNKKRLEYLKRIRSALIAKNSWWLEPSLLREYNPSRKEDYIGDQNYSHNDLKFAIKSFAEKFSRTIIEISNLNFLKTALLRRKIKGPKIQISGIQNMTKDYKTIDGVLNFLFSNEIDIPVNKSLICSFALRKSQVNATEDKVKAGLNLAMLGLATLPNPFMPQTRALRIYKISQNASHLGLIGSLGVEYNETAEDCNSLSVNFGKSIGTETKPADLVSIEELEKCYEKKDRLYNSLVIGAISGVTISQLDKLPKLGQFLKSIKVKASAKMNARKNRQSNVTVQNYVSEAQFIKAKEDAILNISSGKGSPVVVIEDKNGMHHFIIDNTRRSEFPAVFNADKFSSAIEEKVISVLQNRLKQISPEKAAEMKAFTEVNRDRTINIAIVDPSKGDEIMGSISLIKAQNYKNLTFMEDSLRSSFGYAPHTIARGGEKHQLAEIGRLAIDPSFAHRTSASKELLEDAISLAVQDKSIMHVAYYTSEKHYKLYKRATREQNIETGKVVYAIPKKEGVEGSENEVLVLFDSISTRNIRKTHAQVPN